MVHKRREDFWEIFGLNIFHCIAGERLGGRERDKISFQYSIYANKITFFPIKTRIN